MLNDILQAWIVLTSVASILLISSPSPRNTRIGFAIGLAGSPAWLISTTLSGQDGMRFVSFIFAVSYLRGLFPNLLAAIWKGITK